MKEEMKKLKAKYESELKKLKTNQQLKHKHKLTEWEYKNDRKKAMKEKENREEVEERFLTAPSLLFIANCQRYILARSLGNIIDYNMNIAGTIPSEIGLLGDRLEGLQVGKSHQRSTKRRSKGVLGFETRPKLYNRL